MAKTPKVYFRAILETRNFHFEVFEVTEDAARRAMVRAIKRHCQEYRVPADNMLATFQDGITINAIQIGCAYRDREVI